MELNNPVNFFLKKSSSNTIKFDIFAILWLFSVDGGDSSGNFTHSGDFTHFFYMT